MLTHSEVIARNISNIEVIFNEMGGIAPPISNFLDTYEWHYCDTVNRQDRHKIGYKCEFKHTYTKRPFVVITVHSFKEGGQTSVFNSLSTNEDYFRRKPVPVKRKYDESVDTDAKVRKKLYESFLYKWQASSADVNQHPYVLRKKINFVSPLRLIEDKLGCLIQNIEGQTIGIQLIYRDGNKRIHGKKNGGFIPLGDYRKAEKIYLCEGYATADAIYKIASTQRCRSFAVIATIDCKNMHNVAIDLKRKYPSKKFVVCADNDKKTIDKGLGNPGLLAAYEVALDILCPVKVASAQYGSDWNDFLLNAPEEAVTAFKNLDDTALKEIALLHLKQFKKGCRNCDLQRAIFGTFFIWKREYIISESQDSIVNKVYQAVSHTAFTKEDVRIIWGRVKKGFFSRSLRVKSYSMLDKTCFTMSHINEITCLINKLKLQNPRAVFVVSTPMGSGKTKYFMKSNFKEDESRGLMPVVLTPTRALTKGVSDKFKSAHYKDDISYLKRKDGTYPASLCLTINSIIKPIFRDYFEDSRSIFLEEYTQIIRAITNGTVEDDQRHGTEKFLSHVIKTSQYIYVSDADFNQIAYNHLKQMVPEGVPIFVFNTQQKDFSLNYIIHKYKNNRVSSTSFNKAAMDLLTAGDKIYYVSDSKHQIDQLVSSIGNKFKVLCLTSDTIKFSDSEEFLSNPDLYLADHRPDIVICSPAVQSGISIESDYFTKVFGNYTGTVTPTIFQQMLHRVRPQKFFDVLLHNKHGNTVKEIENPTAILNASYQQYLSQFFPNQVRYNKETGETKAGNVSVRKEKGKLLISGDDDFERYERLNAELTALDNEQRNNAVLFFLTQAEARGVKFEVVNHNQTESEVEALSFYQKDRIDSIKKKRKSELVGTNSLSESDYKTLKYSGVKNQQELSQVKRYEISNNLNLKELNEKDVDFYDKKGVSAVRNYLLLVGGEFNALSLDEKDKNKGVAKTNAKWRFSKRRLMLLLVQCLGIDMLTGKGTYGTEKAKQFRSLLIDDDELKRYIIFKMRMTPNSGYSDVSFVNKLVKKFFGITVDRKQIRSGKERFYEYSLNCTDFGHLKHYSDQKMVNCHQVSIYI